MEEMRKEIDIFKNDIKEKINKLNKIIEDVDEYYNIINDIILKYINNKKRNYQILMNINNIINKNNIINNIKKISNNNKYDDIIDIYNKIYNNKNNELNDDDNEINNGDNEKNDKCNERNNINNDDIIIYKIDENKDRIKIFGKDFVENNKNCIKIEIEGKEYQLMEYFKINKNKNKNLEIRIKGIENILERMFLD